MTKRISVPPISEKTNNQAGYVSQIWHAFFVDLKREVDSSSDTNIGGLMSSGGSGDPDELMNHAKLSNLSVTSSKHTVSATDKLIGRSTAGAGVVEEIPLTAAGRALIDDADASAQRTTLNVDQAGADNSTNVTLNASATTGGLSIAGQEISNKAATSAQNGYATSTQITKLTGIADGADVTEDNIPPIAYGALCPDPTNLCADSNFARTTGSSDDTFWLMTDADWAATYGYNSSKGIRLNANGVKNTYLRNDDSVLYLPAIDGNTYHYKIRVKVDAAYDATLFTLLLKQYDKSQTHLADILDSNITFAATDTWYVKTGSLTLNQANCHSIQLGFRVSGGTAGYVYFDDVWIGRVAL